MHSWSSTLDQSKGTKNQQRHPYWVNTDGGAEFFAPFFWVRVGDRECLRYRSTPAVIQYMHTMQDTSCQAFTRAFNKDLACGPRDLSQGGGRRDPEGKGDVFIRRRFEAGGGQGDPPSATRPQHGYALPRLSRPAPTSPTANTPPTCACSTSMRRARNRCARQRKKPNILTKKGTA